MIKYIYMNTINVLLEITFIDINHKFINTFKIISYQWIIPTSTKYLLPNMAKFNQKGNSLEIPNIIKMKWDEVDVLYDLTKLLKAPEKTQKFWYSKTLKRIPPNFPK